MSEKLHKHRHKKWDFLHLLLYHQLNYILLFVFLFIVVTGAIVASIEKNAPLSNIFTVGDGIWWAFSTATTVGYGDFYPTTLLGRMIAISLMFIGFALFSVVTANIASFFVERDEEKELDALHLRINELEDKIDKLLKINN